MLNPPGLSGEPWYCHLYQEQSHTIGFGWSSPWTMALSPHAMATDNKRWTCCIVWADVPMRSDSPWVWFPVLVVCSSFIHFFCSFVRLLYIHQSEWTVLWSHFVVCLCCYIWCHFTKSVRSTIIYTPRWMKWFLKWSSLHPHFFISCSSSSGSEG